MIDLLLVGIGTGNPDHLTRQAIRTLNQADLILIPNKGPKKSDLAGLRLAICETVLTNEKTRIHTFDLPVRDAEQTDYHQRVDDWHDEIAVVWAKAITTQLGHTGRVAFLVWGDPSLYDSTLRIADRVGKIMPLNVTVIPGITSMQALTAAHAIPVNEIGAPFIVTTGRQLREQGWPENTDTVIIMLDGSCSFQSLDDSNIDIFWTAYAGMAEEFSISGKLSDVSAEIIEKRALARKAHGWIMDIYLLRRD